MSAKTPTTDSFMYQTIHRQPQDVRRMLGEGWEPAKRAAELIGGAERVFLTGIGTSYHAALVGSWLLRAAGCDARAISSFDLATYAESFGVRASDAVILMAHTGVKLISAAALHVAVSAGATVVSVGSLTAAHPRSQLVLRTVEREKSAAFTSSHLCAMVALAQVATELGAIGRIPTAEGFRAALEALPGQIADVLARQDEVLPISEYAAGRRIYAAGAGPNEATALEAVIKVREAAYGWIDALALEQFLHGPLVAVNAADVAVLVNVPGRSAQRVGQIATTLEAIGARVWLVGDRVETASSATVFSLPRTDELVSPLLAVVPLQLLAYQIAVHRAVNPDVFRRDNPVYARALAFSPLRSEP